METNDNKSKFKLPPLSEVTPVQHPPLDFFINQNGKYGIPVHTLSAIDWAGKLIFYTKDVNPDKVIFRNAVSMETWNKVNVDAEFESKTNESFNNVMKCYQYIMGIYDCSINGAYLDSKAFKQHKALSDTFEKAKEVTVDVRINNLRERTDLVASIFGDGTQIVNRQLMFNEQPSYVKDHFNEYVHKQFFRTGEVLKFN